MEPTFGKAPPLGAPFLPNAVIFDMDGLMIDSERPGIRAWIDAARELGWDMAEELILQAVGRNEESTKNLLIDAFGPGFPYEKVRDLTRERIIERAEKEGIPHRPGLIALLDHLAALKVPLGVATSTDREAALWKLRKAGILERFSAMTFGDEIRRGKPDPDIFLLAAARLGEAPRDCIGFEDSPAGLMALHAAGIRSVFVKDILEPSPEVLATVWHRCADLAEARALFGH
ncbi:putative beta-phosphoglucomutase (Beta-PGM) [Treponema primitia ZAS-2]|uniref:Putative beta-phosphoglucomutase (Beta-PGM) n=1 Tax=Treponema primitia (strain ATCC BAA-887 / DSM 12427 / ZAS-2) TaxID=545694 RepID=F5YPM5_TREPZ|nr:HAD family phosphatase [Treponema primitia]AEF84410.1 putative beta-phosphoglucomutase (Beta-PGM) [Treponema primitia ZAS-2]